MFKRRHPLAAIVVSFKHTPSARRADMCTTTKLQIPPLHSKNLVSGRFTVQLFFALTKHHTPSSKHNLTLCVCVDL